jgi:predicted transcriptional regulator
MKKKNIPPSKVKYDHSHPTVSIRVDKKLKDDLDELRTKGGKSLGDILREAVGKQLPIVEHAYQDGFAEGQASAAFYFPCGKCGGLIQIISQEDRQLVAESLKECGLGHKTCNPPDGPKEPLGNQGAYSIMNNE